MNKALFGILLLFVLVLSEHGAFAKRRNRRKRSKRGLNFMVIGDWGGQFKSPYYSPIETAIANQMGFYADQDGTDFVLGLGDNFYLLGVRNVDDPRFQSTFENVFVAPSLQIPWYLIAGNHDYYGNESAEIAYTQKSERWNFPDYYYKQSFKIPGTKNKELDVVMIDTIKLCGISSADDVPGDTTRGLLTRKDEEASEAEWAWLEETLQSSTAHYLIVNGHFPVWSVAEHGPTHCLIDRLKPMLEKYDVTAYFCGHDHNLQHLTDGNVEYFVSGSGAKYQNTIENIDNVPEGSLKFFWADPPSYGGFAEVHATRWSMQVRFIDAGGDVLYTTKMRPRRNRSVAGRRKPPCM